MKVKDADSHLKFKQKQKDDDKVIQIPQKRVSLTIPRLDSDDDQKEVSSTRPAVKPVLSPSSHPSPPSHQQAKRREISSHQVQIMKGSFFSDQTSLQEKVDSTVEMDFTCTDLLLQQKKPQKTSAPSFPVGSLLSKSAILFPSQSVKPQYETFEVQSDEEMPSSPHTTQPGEEFSTPAKDDQMELSEKEGLMSTYVADVPKEILSQVVPDQFSRTRELMKTDAAAFLGKSFRVGWGPNWSIYHSGFSISELGRGKTQFSSYSESPEQADILPIRVVVEQVSSHPLQLIQHHRFPINGAYLPLLRIQLEHSITSGKVGPHQLPLYKSNVGPSLLHSFASLPRDLWPNDMPNSIHMWQVWQLCKALWGPLPEEEGRMSLKTFSLPKISTNLSFCFVPFSSLQ